MIAAQYETQRVMTASPMELVLMLYDNAIRHLSAALEASEIEDYPARMQAFNHSLLRAQDFVAELACSVDIERGGEMAENLNRLYEFMMRHLISANTEGRSEPVRDVMTMLKELREGWTEAMKGLPNEEPNEPVPVPRTSSFRFSG